MTPNQKRREAIAAMCDRIARGRSQIAAQLRAKNRRIELRKGKTNKLKA